MLSLFVLIMMGNVSTAGNSGSGPDIVMRVTPRENGAPVPGVSIKVIKDTLVITDAKTVKPDGWLPSPQTIDIKLKEGTKYSMIITKKGYVKTIINIDTHLPADVPSDKPFITEVDIKMLKSEQHPDLDNSDFPLALLQYDKELKKFVPSKAYAASVRMMLQSK